VDLRRDPDQRGDAVSETGNRYDERIAYQFTFVSRREGSQWSSLACEVDVASCGDTLDAAREALKEAVGLYVAYMIGNGMRESVARQVPEAALQEFTADRAGGDLVVERLTMLVLLRQAPAPLEVATEFVPTELASMVCPGLTALRAR
jgi:predicted RNase H-like HicB family nuclease